MQFVEKKKAGHDFGRVCINNSVELATNARIDIMRIMAEIFPTESEVVCHVILIPAGNHLQPKDLRHFC
jgi:hypothetical protein